MKKWDKLINLALAWMMAWIALDSTAPGVFRAFILVGAIAFIVPLGHAPRLGEK